MAMTDFAIIRRSLMARLPSTIVTVVMVAIGVALVLVLMSMRNAGQRAFERGPGTMHMLVSRDDSSLVAVLNGIFYANPPRRPIAWQEYLEYADGPFEYAIPVQQGDSYAGFPVLATLPTFFSQFQPSYEEPWNFVEGQSFERAYQVVVGAKVASVTGLEVGDIIVLTHGVPGSANNVDGMEPHVHDEYKYEIVGVLGATGGPHDRALFTHLEGSWVIHAHDRRRMIDPSITETTVDDLEDVDRLITGIYIRVQTRGGAVLSGMQQAVFDGFRSDTTITVADPGQEIQGLFNIIGHIDGILLAMAIIVLFSSGAGILLALYNSMAERRGQIAVLRVLGCTSGRICGLVMTESAVIGMIGGVVGVVIAFFGGVLVAGELRDRLQLVVEPTVPLDIALVVVVATIFLAALAGLGPALMAYRTDVGRNLD